MRSLRQGQNAKLIALALMVALRESKNFGQKVLCFAERTMSANAINFAFGLPQASHCSGTPATIWKRPLDHDPFNVNRDHGLAFV